MWTVVKYDKKKLKSIFVENIPHDIPDVSFKGPF